MPWCGYLPARRYGLHNAFVIGFQIVNFFLLLLKSIYKHKQHGIVVHAFIGANYPLAISIFKWLNHVRCYFLQIGCQGAYAAFFGW